MRQQRNRPPSRNAVTAGVPAPAEILSPIGPTTIRNLYTGRCIDLPGFGPGVANGPVNQYTCNSSSADNQIFVLDDLNIGDGLYYIRNVKDNLCLDVPGFGSVPAGTLVSEYFCNHTLNDNQLFIATRRADGGRWLYNIASGLCLDVAGVRTGGNDARLTLFNCNDNDDHSWIF